MIGSPARVRMFGRDELIDSAVQLLALTYGRGMRHRFGVGGDGGAGKTQVLASLGGSLEGALGIPGIYIDARYYSKGVQPRGVGQIARLLLWSSGYPLSELPADDDFAVASWHARADRMRMVIVLDNVDDIALIDALVANSDRNIWIVGTRRRKMSLDTFLWLPALSPAAEGEYIEQAFVSAGRVENLQAAKAVVSKLCRGNAFWLTRLTELLLGREDLEEALRELSTFASDVTEELDYARVQDGTLALLTPEARELYIQLAAPGNIHFTYKSAAALMNIDVRVARLLLLELHSYRLVIRQQSDDFVFHDIARDDARTRMDQLPHTVRASIVGREALFLTAELAEVRGTAPEVRARIVEDLLLVSTRLSEFGSYSELGIALEALDQRAVNVGLGAGLRELGDLILSLQNIPRSIRLRAVMCISRVRWSDGEFASAGALARSALDSEVLDAERTVRTELWLIVAFAHERQGDLALGLKALDNARRLATTSLSMSRVWRIHGAIQFRSRDYENAVASFMEAELALATLKDEESSARIANNVGFTLRALGMPELALEWLHTALGLAKGIDDWSGYLTSTVNYMFVMGDIGDLYGVRARSQEALQIASQIQSRFEDARARWALALAEIRSGDRLVGHQELRKAYLAFSEQGAMEADQLARDWPILRKMEDPK